MMGTPNMHSTSHPGFWTLAGGLLAISAPGVLSAAEIGSGTTVVGPSEIINTALSLLLIVGAIMALAWLLNRLQGGRSHNGGLINVVASHALGAKERLLVVDVGGRQLVVGVTASQISTLHVLDEPLDVGVSSVERVNFSERLKNVIKAGAPT